MNAREGLPDIKSRAEKFIAAHDEMIRIGQGVGGLAVKRPDLMPDFDAWWHASEVEHADTVLAVIEALTPRTITTREELAEAHMVVVRTEAGTIANLVNGRAYCFGYEASVPVETLALPVTVLHEPEARS